MEHSNMGFEEQERGDYLGGEEDGEEDEEGDVTVFAGVRVRDSGRGSYIRDSHDNDAINDRDDDGDGYSPTDGYRYNDNDNGYSNSDGDGDADVGGYREGYQNGNVDGYSDGDGDGDENGTAPSPFSRTIGRDDGDGNRDGGVGSRVASTATAAVPASSSSSCVDLWPDYCNPSYRMPGTIDVRIETDHDTGGGGGGEYFIQVHVVKAVPGSKIYLGEGIGLDWVRRYLIRLFFLPSITRLTFL
jgi:hypothetical protein